MEWFREKCPPACTGGFHAVAEALGWRTQRRRRHACADIHEAAALVKGYLDGLPESSPARGQMPSALSSPRLGTTTYAMHCR